MAEDPQGMAAVTTTLQALADRVAQGGVLEDGEAGIVVASYDLITIGMMADDVRRQMHGAETTFLRVFEMHVDAVPAVLPESVAAGEYRLVGRPGSPEMASAAVERVRRLAGGDVVSGFSLGDLAALAEADSTIYLRLKRAGLDAIAEVPIEEATAGVVGAAREAGLTVQRLTVHAPVDPLVLIERAGQLQAALGGFRTFAPLPRTTPVAAPTTGYDDVKLVALTRLMLRAIPSVQVDWPLYGPKLAQVALTVGADDVDGVAAADPGGLGVRRSPLEEIRGNIRAAGLQPVERDGRFEVRGR